MFSCKLVKQDAGMLIKVQGEGSCVFVSQVSMCSYCCHESHMRFLELIFIIFFFLCKCFLSMFILIFFFTRKLFLSGVRKNPVLFYP